MRHLLPSLVLPLLLGPGASAESSEPPAAVADAPRLEAREPGVALANPDEHERLARGELLIDVRKLEGSGINEARVRSVIEAPPEHVWAVIHDCGNYINTMNRVKSSEEWRNERDHQMCRVTMDAPWPFPDPTTTAEVENVAEENHYRRRWRMIEGDYEHNDGSWVLTAFDGDATRTLATYEVRVKTKVHIPGAVQRWLQESQIPGMMDRLELEARKVTARTQLELRAAPPPSFRNR